MEYAAANNMATAKILFFMASLLLNARPASLRPALVNRATFPVDGKDSWSQEGVNWQLLTP
jgi:hypothetical protein